MSAGAGSVVGAAGGLYAGAQARKGAYRAAELSDYNAKVSVQKAKGIKRDTEFAQRRHAKAGARILSSQKARAGHSGADVQSGANLALDYEQSEELELESLLIGLEGREAQERMMSQAAIDTKQGELTRLKGDNQRIASYIGAGSSLIGGMK